MKKVNIIKQTVSRPLLLALKKIQILSLSMIMEIVLMMIYLIMLLMKLIRITTLNGLNVNTRCNLGGELRLLDFYGLSDSW